MKIKLFHLIILAMVFLSCNKVDLTLDEFELLQKATLNQSRIGEEQFKNLRRNLMTGPADHSLKEHMINAGLILDDVYKLIDNLSYESPFDNYEISGKTLALIKEHTLDFNNQVEVIAPSMLQSFDQERIQLLHQLQRKNQAGVLSIIFAGYCLRFQKLNHELINLKSKEIEVSEVNYNDPHFNIEIVSNSNVLIASDSLRFKMLDFTYFKVNPDKVNFSFNDKDFTFMDEYAELVIPIAVSHGTRFEDLKIQTNLQLYQYGTYVPDEINYRLKISSCQ